MGGLFAGFRTSRNSVGQLEANYVQKGGDGVSLDYIEIPFTAGAVLPLGQSGARVRLYTGIGLGFKVSCDSSDIRLNCNLARGTEWTWPFGISLGKTSQSLYYAIDARYSIPLSDAFDSHIAANYSWQFRLFLGKPIN